MFHRISASLSYFRPRTLARTGRAVDLLAADTSELKRTAKLLIDRHRDTETRIERVSAELGGQLTILGRELGEVKQMLTTLALREAQVRAILHADTVLDDHLAALPSVLDEVRIASQVRASVEHAKLRSNPFPYVILEDLFPDDFYDALVRSIPPAELFADNPANQQQLPVPFTLAPAYSRQVWKYMARVVAPRIMRPILTEKFRQPLEQWIAGNWPELAGAPLGPPMELSSSAGRILRRERGYNIPPHRDPKWGFLTCLVYLVRPGDRKTWGTQLYAVDDDQEARGALPHWIPLERCRLVKEVPFRYNTALVFLNSTGAHGATIPEDAEPADLQRYAYQFRIGASRESIAALMKLLPEDRRAAWDGKLVDD